MNISSPEPVPYDGGEGSPAPPGTAYEAVSPALLAVDFQRTIEKESQTASSP